MADESEFSPEEPRRDSSADVAALHFALNAAAGSAEAKAYLRKQSEVAAQQAEFVKLQAEQLRDEMQLNLSHLRFRRYGDFTKSAFEIAVGLVILLAICGLGTMVWNAAHDHDLVVDAFSVPPDMAAKGLTGQVLADQILDRYLAMGRSGFSLVGDLRNSHDSKADETRVEIPETGISLDQLDHYLRDWLGHETHVRGELVQNGDQLTLTVRYGDQPGTTATGSTKDMDKLLEQSAENLFKAVQPLRFADYLSQHGHLDEGAAIAKALTQKENNKDAALAYLSLAVNSAVGGAQRAFEQYAEMAAELDPHNFAARMAVSAAANNLGQDETNWRALKAASAMPEASAATTSTERRLALMITTTLAALSGDYKGALAICDAAPDHGIGCRNEDMGGYYGSMHEYARGREFNARQTNYHFGEKTNPDVLFNNVQITLLEGDYPKAVRLSAEAEKAVAGNASEAFNRDIFLRPFEAEALARTGNVAAAKALLASLPLDCDECVRGRGRVDAIAKNWNGAAYWFAMVAARAPDIVQNDTDWGRMLLAKGDYPGAIAKFKQANVVGPRFADPLEMWGEALMLENRSDLALAKFEEADKYAPNWGRLHLEWGKALFYAGHKDEAKAQLARAAALELSAPDRAALKKWIAQHG